LQRTPEYECQTKQAAHGTDGPGFPHRQNPLEEEEEEKEPETCRQANLFARTLNERLMSEPVDPRMTKKPRFVIPMLDDRPDSRIRVATT
jgi:hypothetical protein